MARGKTIFVGSSSSALMDDSNSPHLLHSNDHPGLILVSHYFIGLNNHTWLHEMVMALTTKNKLIFINGMLPHPSSTDLFFFVWSRSDSKVSSWILNVVSKDIVDSLLYLDLASVIWFNLCEHFQQENGPRIFQIKQ